MPWNKQEITKNPDDVLQVSPNEKELGKDGGATPPAPVGRRMLKFRDGTFVGVNGLKEILAELYAEGKNATEETAEEAIKRLEAKKNYIPSSCHVRREYAYALLDKYRAYIEDRSGST